MDGRVAVDRAGQDAGTGREKQQAAQADRGFARAWAAALGGRRHADRAMPPPRRPGAPLCASVPRVIGLPLTHSPVPCALGFLQRPPDSCATTAGGPAAQREGAMR